MNIWHSMSPKRVNADYFVAVIEIARGSKKKYELDKETGLIEMDRILHTSTHYPANYGFIPRTYADDNDPLDVFVLCSQPIEKMSLVRCFPIGVVDMRDRNEGDQKIIAIPFGDPQYNGYRDISELPSHIVDELRHFLTVYKQLENKKVEVLETNGCKKAEECIENAMKQYRKIILGEK